MGSIYLFFANRRLRRETAGRLKELSETNRNLRAEIENRKIVEEELRESRRRLELVLESSGLGYWDWDLRTDDVYYAPQSLSLLGYSPNDIENDIGLLEKLTHPDDYPVVLRALQKHFEKSVDAVEVDYRLRHKSGEWRWIHGRAKTVERDERGAPIRLTGTIKDITGRKQAEQELRESEERFRRLSEMVFNGTAVTADGIIIETNQAFVDMVGYDIDDLMGTSLFDLFAADAQEVIACAVEEDRDTSFENLCRRKDGSTFPVEVGVAVVRYGGRPARLVAIRDISEQRKALELAVRTERLEAIAQLASGVGHNFNNLLQILLGEIHSAREAEEQSSTRGLNEHLDRMLRTVHMGVDTVKRLQTLAHTGESDEQGSDRVFDMCRCVEQAVEMTQPWWRKHAEGEACRIDLVLHLDRDCTVRGVEGELFEVAVNLIKNAIEAVGDEGSIRVSTGIVGESVVLKVQDTGAGIAPEHLERVFEPFWSSKGGKGTGMGLAVSRSIVSSHGGRIQAFSKGPGLGSEFVVELPYRSESRPAALPAQENDLTIALTTLVIDDVEAVLSMFAQVLRKKGMTVYTGRSGREGVQLYQEHAIDLVICDLAMPDMDGRQVAEKIRGIAEERGKPRSPFIMITGWAGPGNVREEPLQKGVDAILKKPVDMNVLLETVDLVTKKHFREN